MHEIERRAAATRATVERFNGKPFDWSTTATCIHMLRYQAAKLGHELPVIPRFRTALSARKALKSVGHDSLIGLLDDHFTRVAPAYLRTGDVIALPGNNEFEALAIKCAFSKYVGWREEGSGCTIVEIDVSDSLGAWWL